MKLSEKWLREWVDPRLSREALIHTLTMAGLSVESCDLFENSLDEYILEFELTPNRGDCLSVLGIAREISALTNMSFETQPHSQSQMQNKNIPVKINIQSPERCPYYAGRVISNISENASAPDYIQLRLKQSGIKLIHPVVDVMNYVMLEIGQPLHAFDWKIFDSHAEKEVIIRHAKKGETLVLLDNKTLALQADTLVIADKNQAHAMAGIMGGLASSVTQNTRAIFIESAFFTPEAIRGRARRYGLSTDASQRFERGVDPLLPRKALERATELLSQIYSNLIIADIIEKSSTEYFPHSIQIVLRPARVEKLLGLKLSSEQIQAILLKLNITVIRDQAENFLCTPPSYRFDLKEEIDLIEEIARLYGYDNLPAHRHLSSVKPLPKPENQITVSDIKKSLLYQGYEEVITYSFISEKLHHQFAPDNKPLKLENPLSSEHAVMRTNLWGGLVETVLYNLNRQHEYLRFFETGARFVKSDQEDVLSGVCAGKALPEQWAEKNRPVDFFDIKNTLMQLFSLTREETAFEFEAGTHPALQPGQTAKIFKAGKCVGFCGALHPALSSAFGINMPVFLFEIKLTAIMEIQLPYFQAFSKFPAVRRDIALVIDKSIESKIIIKIIKNSNKNYLKDITVFDVYEGKNLPAGKKSLAIGLIFQASDRTLVEEEIQGLITDILQTLKSETGAVLRE